MEIQKIFSHIEENTERYVKFLADICGFEATARDKKTLDALSDFITDFAENEGFSTRRVPFAQCGDFLVVEMNKDAADKGAVFLSHLDTVHEKGVFGSPAVRVEGDRMIGPGTIDCKGGVAISLLTMLALKKEGYQKHLKLLLTTDEEISNVLGGEQEQQFFREEVAGFPMALNGEVANTGEVTTSRKGILRFEVTVIGKGGHAGISYFETVNPVLEAAHKIIALQACSVRGGTTYSCNVVHAGSVSNVIPDECTFTVDVRVCKRAEMDTADRRVREICAKSFLGGTDARVIRLGMRPPMEPSADTDALFARLAEIGREYALEELTPVASGGGSDSAYTQAAGVTSLCGLGGCGAFCHTSREYIEIPSVPRRAKLLAALLAKGENK